MENTSNYNFTDKAYTKSIFLVAIAPLSQRAFSKSNASAAVFGELVYVFTYLDFRPPFWRKIYQNENTQIPHQEDSIGSQMLPKDNHGAN